MKVLVVKRADEIQPYDRIVVGIEADGTRIEVVRPRVFTVTPGHETVYLVTEAGAGSLPSDGLLCVFTETSL